jgi:HK97 family phage prohead protease
MQAKIERRNYAKSELRAVSEEGGKRKIVGYAAVFNSLSEDLGGFRERIAPGAFTRACKEDDVRALLNHNSDYVLARTKSGTLRISEDDYGLKIECDPPDSQWANDMMASIDRGDIDQMSFGFRVAKEGDIWDEIDGESVRTLRNVDLFDVSVVAFPAYPDTTVGLRSLEIWKKAEEPKADYRIGLMKKKLELKSRY